MSHKENPVRFVGGLGLVLALTFLPPIFSRAFSLWLLTQNERNVLWLTSFLVGLSALTLFFKKNPYRHTLAAASIGIYLLCYLELGARFIVNLSPRTVKDKTNKLALIAYPDRWRYKGHPFFQFTGNSVYFHNLYNEGGFFRNRKGNNLPKTERSYSTTRIACIGGSTTAQGYPEVMSEYLNGLGDATFEVMNLGMDGHNSAHAVAKLALFAAHYKPDFVVFHNAWNEMLVRDSDRFKVDYTHSYQAFSPRQPLDTPVLKLSVLYRWVRQQIKPQSGFKEFHLATLVREYMPRSYHDWRDLIPYENNIRSFIAIAKAHGAIPVLTTQPHSTDPLVEDFETATHIDQCNEIVRALAHEYSESILFVDLDKQITGIHEAYLKDLAHMTESGRKHKAETIAKAIIKHLACKEKGNCQSNATPIS